MNRALFQLTLLVGLSGCLRFGYAPASPPKAPAAAADAGAMDASRDGGPGSTDAARDAGTVMAMPQPDAGAQDAAVSGDPVHDAGSSDAATPDAATPPGDDSDAGAPPACPGAVNACGGCQALSAAPGSACGACGVGANVCSGSDAVVCMGGSQMPSTSSGALLLDDFEDGDRFFSAGPIRGRWFLVSDSTTGTLSPATDDALVPTSAGANGSTRSLHVSGSGFSKWGAGVQGSLNLSGCYVNATAQTGVSLYARGTGTVLLSVATKQTTPTSDGGTCIGACYDNFATSFTLTSSWKPYQIPWSMLHQSGWGTATTFQPSQLNYLQLSFDAGSSMDLYFDEVQLY